MTYAGWFGRPRCGTGARYGLSVSASIRSSGHSRAAACTSVADLNVTMPLKLRNAPRSRHRRASSGPPVKQWKISPLGGSPRASRTSNVSSHASRVWMTAGGRARGRAAICCGERRALRRRGASGRRSSRARTRRPRHRRVVEERDDRVDAVTRLVRVQPGGGEHVRDGAARASIAGMRAGRVAADVDHRGRRRPRAPRRAPRRASTPRVSSRWQWLSTYRRRRSRRRLERSDGRRLLLRGKSGVALGDGEPAGVAAPRGRGRQPLVGDVARAARSAPRRSGTCRAAPARRGPTTIRSASSASPITASTAGPGSIFHGSFASRYAFVARISDHVASSARLGCTSSHAAAAPSTQPRPRLGERRVGARRRPDAVALLADHGRDARQQVAEVVGEVAVVPAGQALVGEVAVLRRTGVSASM